MSFFGDINEVRLLGNVTNEPEVRYTPNGTPVANFSVATNRRYKQGEEWKEEVEFHNIVAWSNLASGMLNRVKKGTRMMITGRITTRSWEGQDGQKRYKTEVVADDIFLIDRYERGKQADLDAAAGAASPSSPTSSANSANTSTQPQPPAGKSDTSSKAKGSKSDEDVIDPDDLPF